jgi:hypothetical protein
MCNNFYSTGGNIIKAKVEESLEFGKEKTLKLKFWKKVE